MARYAKSGDLHIAYTVQGDGPIDLVWIPPWISQVEYLWSEASLERVMARLTEFARVITFDRRGSGLSDPLFGAPTLEDQMDDVLAVMDAAESESAAICGTLEGGPMASLFAATFPERTNALVLYATFARATWAPGYEWAWPAEMRDAHMDELLAHWGEGWIASSVAPSQQSDPSFMEWAGRLERLAASPGTIRRIFDLIGGFDVRDVLPSIRVPTLVMHRTEDSFLKVEHSRYIASQIPGARYVELEGGDNMFSIGRLRRPARGGRGVPDRHAARARARPDARDRDVHRHRGLHATRGGDGRPRLALPARAPRRAVPAGARAPPGQGGQAHGRRLHGHLRRPRARHPLRRLGGRGDGDARPGGARRAFTRASSR